MHNHLQFKQVLLLLHHGARQTHFALTSVLRIPGPELSPLRRSSADLSTIPTATISKRREQQKSERGKSRAGSKQWFRTDDDHRYFSGVTQWESAVVFFHDKLRELERAGHSTLTTRPWSKLYSPFPTFFSIE
uniref:Uncharacterized protein n=1 Tax=Knipowitschia caucasica TaxID=637954 RepID=A0AAV2K877_KNICA